MIAPQFPALLGADATSSPLLSAGPLGTGPLLGSTGDILHLIVDAKGVVLIVAIILIVMMVLTVFVMFYKLVHITQAQAQSITFLDRFWDSKRLDEIYQVAERLKRSPIAAMFRAGYVELSKVKRSRDAAHGQMGMEATVSMHERAGDADNVERALARARLAENTKLENLLPFLATTGSAVSEKFQDSTRNMITTSSRDARARSRAGCLSGWTAATGGEFASTRAAIVKSP